MKENIDKYKNILKTKKIHVSYFIGEELSKKIIKLDEEYSKKFILKFIKTTIHLPFLYSKKRAKKRSNMSENEKKLQTGFIKINKITYNNITKKTIERLDSFDIEIDNQIYFKNFPSFFNKDLTYVKIRKMINEEFDEDYQEFEKNFETYLKIKVFCYKLY